MEGMLRGLRLLLTCLLVPAALLSLLVLIVLAALWYYAHSLAYFVQLLMPRGPSSAAPESVLPRPHMTDRPSRRVPSDKR